MLWYSKRAQKRAKKIYLERKARKERQKHRTWKAGRLITFVSFDIFKHEHRFVCQMRKVNEYFRAHRCMQCRIFNNYRPCMDIRGEMSKKCMQKSDLSCYPHIVKKCKLQI
jgi:hypothetical protein